MADMNFFDRPLAFTDVETTGTDELVHEIVEIGLVVADQRSLQVVGELDLKVKPEHIELATPEALAVNGYLEEDWRDALALSEAMKIYAAMTKDAVFVAHNATFDWSFIKMAFRLTGVANEMDYHRLCSMSMCWYELRQAGLSKFGLKYAARHLGVPEEPLPHRAINGARTAFEVFKRLAARP